MTEIRLRKIHRGVGIAMAPFLVLQGLSGLLLDFGLFRRTGGLLGGNQGSFLVQSGWDALLVKTHYGPGLISDLYHLLLGAAIVWMASSGWILYLRIRERLRTTGR